MAEQPDAWERPTMPPGWEVRDVIGHLVDVTESYFVGFDAAREGSAVPDAYGMPGMAARLNEKAQALRSESQAAMMARVRRDFEQMMSIEEGLSEKEWTELIVPHFYMGPLPAFFYPAFQLMDYGVHSWDVRQGTGRAHGLSGEAADLLIPFMFVLWKYTVGSNEPEPCDMGIRITSGPNAGDTRVTVGPDGMDYQPGDAAGLPAVLEFDPGSFVLTAFGRSNAGTIRGDRTVADRYLNLFFRI
jgi:uncharacterized protein (TIGR03083 family)